MRRLSHDDFLALVPIPLDRKIGIDRIGGILPCDGEQDTHSTDPGIIEPVLDGRLDADDSGSVQRTSVDRMSIRPPGGGAHGDEFEVVGQPLLTPRRSYTSRTIQNKMSERI